MACISQAVSSGTRASSDPVRHYLSGLAPRSQGLFPNASLVASSAAAVEHACPSASSAHAASQLTSQRGWGAAEAMSAPPEVLGYGGHRLSSAAPPFSPSHGGYGIDPGGYDGAARRGVQVRGAKMRNDGLMR